MDVLDMSAADAALWIAARFPVPSVPRRRPVPKPHASYRVGYENGIGLLVRSGLWGTLSEAARCIAPVLLEMAERVSPGSEEFTLQISYVGITRFSGVRSHRAIRNALIELADIGFVRLPCDGMRKSPERGAARYIITPFADELREAANAFAAQLIIEIAAEKELRKRARQQRIRLLRDAA
jgi:predicted transcriptional regulator